MKPEYRRSESGLSYSEWGRTAWFANGSPDYIGTATPHQDGEWWIALTPSGFHRSFATEDDAVAWLEKEADGAAFDVHWRVVL